MRRREFTRLAAALASLFAAPFGATAVSQRALATDDHPLAKVTRLRVGTWQTADLRRANRIARAAGVALPWPEPPDDDSNYWAEIIEDGDRHFYRVGDTTVEISKLEYERVLSNPNLYYFSRALKVHYRLTRATDGIVESLPT